MGTHFKYFNMEGYFNTNRVGQSYERKIINVDRNSVLPLGGKETITNVGTVLFIQSLRVFNLRQQ